MSFTIEVFSRDDDGYEYLHEITKRLNEKFKSIEDMEYRFEIYCEQVAEELDGTVGFSEEGRIVFNFTGYSRKDGEPFDAPDENREE